MAFFFNRKLKDKNQINFPEIYLILLFVLLLFNCEKAVQVVFENDGKCIKKNMDNKLVVNLKSNKKSPLKINILLHNLTDDAADMPIFTKEFMAYPGNNFYIIPLKEIGLGKYSLRLYYHKDLIDYRILDISP